MSSWPYACVFSGLGVVAQQSRCTERCHQTARSDAQGDQLLDHGSRYVKALYSCNYGMVAVGCSQLGVHHQGYCGQEDDQPVPRDLC